MNLVIQQPSKRQQEFLRDRHRYVAFGGARGGGKSWAVRTKAKLLAVKYAGIRICIIRKTWAELRSNHIDLLRCELEGGIAKYRESTKEFTFFNGSKIFCRYCQNEGDLSKLQGNEFDVVFIDEATQFTEQMFRMISACVRGVNAFPKRVYLTCNPGGIGHAWVKRLFVDRRFTPNEKPDDYSFIRSLVTDNPALMKADPEYAKQLKMLPAKLRRAWLNGDWDIFEGQFFEEFRDDPDRYTDRKFTHVIEPFEVPADWQIYRSYDFGFAKPFDCSWWAVDCDGRAYLILQYYGSTGAPNEGLHMTPDMQFEKIAEIERSHRWLKGKNIIGVADPSIWDSSRGESIADTASKYYLYFTPGDNKRVPGWMQCHYRLQFDSEGLPMVYFFNTCRDAIRTLPSLVFSKTHPEDVDTEGEDHFADSFRYFAMSRPLKGDSPSAPSQKSSDDPLNLHTRKYREFSY